jgi:hypothetical protein
MLQPFCALYAYGSGTDMHPDYAYQFFTHMLSMRISFPIFQMSIMYQELMRMQNISVRN